MYRPGRRAYNSSSAAEGSNVKKRAIKSATSLLLAAAAMLAIAGCGGTGSVNLNAFPPDAIPEEAEAGAVEIAITKSSRNAAFVSQPLFDEFEKRTGIRVNLQILPTEQVTAALQTKLAVGETPDRKSTRLNSSHIQKSRMPSSA